MKLSRSLALGAACVTALLLAALLVAAFLLTPQVDKVDIERAQAKLDRAVKFLRNDGERLRTAATARAQHDETYNWALGRDQTFYRETLNPERILALKVDALLVFDEKFKLRAWAISPVQPRPDDIVDAMRALPVDGKTYTLLQKQRTFGGLAPGLGRLWQMAGARITRYDGSGEGAGFLVMLREVDQGSLDLAGELTGGVFTLHVADPRAPNGAKPSYEPVLSRSHVHVARTLTSFWGEEIAVLAAQAPRHTAVLFERVLWVHCAVLVGAALTAALIGVLLLRIGVVKPLRELTDAVRTARGEAGDRRRPACVDRGDELGELCRAFDTLICESVEREAQLREQTGAAQSAARAKADFLSVMSHEIRTPLNGVVSVARVLQKSPLGERQREMVDLIAASGASLERLLNDVLDLAKVEAGGLSLEEQTFDLQEALASVIALFETKADEKGLYLRVHAPESARGPFRGDPIRLRQILGNLLSNAVKFTEAGGVTLHIEVDETPEGVATLILRVSDTGPGFDAEAKGRLFNRFEQADASITRRFGGTGLGLSIARDLARLMGGDIVADARPGKGAVFTAWVALKRATDAVPAPLTADGAPRAAGLRVLAADDNANNRRVLQMILEAADIDVTTALDGAEAVDLFRTQRFDAVLMDMQMPVMDGLSAIRAIRALENDEGRAPTPILAVTANAMAHQVAQALEAGADSHVSKPIDPARLLTALANAHHAAVAQSGALAEVDSRAV